MEETLTPFIAWALVTAGLATWAQAICESQQTVMTKA
jgi:hypothetical protein